MNIIDVLEYISNNEKHDSYFYFESSDDSDDLVYRGTYLYLYDPDYHEELLMEVKHIFILLSNNIQYKLRT